MRQFQSKDESLPGEEDKDKENNFACMEQNKVDIAPSIVKEFNQNQIIALAKHN